MTPVKYAKSVFDAIALPVNIARVWLRARGSDAIVLHNGRFKSIPPGVLIPVFCRSKRGGLTKPPNLTILLVHNRPDKTLMEQSLEYLGIRDYTVLRLPSDQPWRHTARIAAILDHLRSGACATEYILVSDSDDALIRDDPQKAIDLLRAADCEMLVSSTAYAAYHGMPDVKIKTMSLAPPQRDGSRHPRIHLNAGVYIARASFLREYLEATRQYVSEHDLAIEKLNIISDEDLLRLLPDFPRGVGSDQTIMRYLFPQFYPRMKIDYDERLARR